MRQLPLISVGLPVYNEERFIEKALCSLAKQTYPNLEIIISDNGSNDRTEQICRDFSKRFEHISYHRFEKNIGPTENFRYVLNQANGEYFMWAAGHDWWAENYLEECSKVLHTHTTAMLAFGTSQWIDSEDQPYPQETGWSDTRGMNVIARYFTVFWGNMNPVLGLMRTPALRKCSIDDTVGLDLIILTQLALQGDLVHSHKTCWSRREFRNEPNYKQKLKRYRSTEYALSKSLLSKCFPLAKLPFKLLKVVIQASLPLNARLLILFLLLPSLPIKYLSDKYFR